MTKTTKTSAPAKTGPAIRGTVREAASIDATRFDEVSKALEETGDRNDCAVKAIAIATGADPLDVQKRLEIRGRKKGEGTLLADVRAVLEDLGFDLSSVSPKKVIAKYPGVHRNLQNVTTGHPSRFPAAWEDLFAGKTLFLYSTDHFSAIVDGVNQDWSRSRSKRVIAIYEMKKARRPRATKATEEASK